MFIRSEIKMVMVFLPGSASAYPAGVARGLLTASRQDLAWQEAGQATPRVA